MFAGNLTLSDFFTVLNFLVLVGLGAYLFKRHLLDTLKAQIHDQEKHLQGLKQQKEDLRGQLRFLEKSLEEQEQLGAELSSKIQRWHDVHEHNLATQRSEYERLQLNLQKKIETQNDYTQIERANRLIMPEVIRESTEALRKKFASDSAGQHYIAGVLSSLEKGNHE